jgi:two-component system OmpR family response regulator
MLRPKVLVVDDSRTLRVQLCRTLCLAGYDVRAVADGADALSRVADEPPSVLILDIQMPDMDGYEVCQVLKRMGEPGQLKMWYCLSWLWQGHRIKVWINDSLLAFL